MRNIQAITALHRAFGQGEVVNAIENIGFPAAIQSQKTVDLWTKDQAGFKVIFKLDEVKGLQKHGSGNYLSGSLIFRSGLLYLGPKIAYFD